MNKTVRSRLFRLFLVLMTTLTPPLYGQLPDDAICKGNPIPPGLVTTAEMRSLDCPLHDPYEKNAWVLGPLADGVVSCTPPDYERDPAENLRFLACGRKQSVGCAAHLDGTANGLLLRTTKSCSMPLIQELCDPQSPQDDPFAIPLTHLHRDACGIPPSSNATSFIHLNPGQAVPACGLYPFTSKPLFFYRQSDPYVEGNPSDVYSDRLIIVRQFFNPDCMGRNRFGLNAVVVKRIVVKKTDKSKVFACKDDRDDSKATFHSDLCGVNNGDNALFLDYSLKT